MTGLLPEMVGEFFGVGSIGEKDHETPLDYIKSLTVPYAYQITSNREEDMIRQFAAAVDGFEEIDDFILDLDFGVFRDIVDNDNPIFMEKKYFPSMYILLNGQKYRFFKTQLTAPSTMCFSTRGSDGKQLVSPQMFRFYTVLMKRLAKGFMEQLGTSAQNIILCQDDPALAYVFNMIDKGQAGNLTAETIMKTIDGIFPTNVIPAYHYCDDWRQVDIDGWFPIWESSPKIVHIDLVRYDPYLESQQAEIINKFLEKGGGLALGVLPNVDEGFSSPIIDVLKKNLFNAIKGFIKSGVNIDLLGSSAMISTQCGLSRASPKLTRDIHISSEQFAGIFKQVIGEIH